jgi:hypothetical protein
MAAASARKHSIAIAARLTIAACIRDHRSYRAHRAQQAFTHSQ